MNRLRIYGFVSLASLWAAAPAATPAYAQMDLGPRVERTYGEGLPRDRDLLIFDDDQYPVWPLTAAQMQYASIDGARMKRQVIDLSQISVRYRDAGNKWWGRLPGTTADVETMEYSVRVFQDLGLSVEQFPYIIPEDWRPTDWAASYRTAGGQVVNLTTAFPVADTKATGPQSITAEAIWVGIGAGADFLGRDVRGKAVVIYSTFVPGGRSHSASDRAGLFNANARAVELGAAMVINVMGVPGNGEYQPEGGLPTVPQFTLSMDEGFALRDRLDTGERVDVTFRLEVPELRNVETSYIIATLPGVSTDEEILVMAHTDGYFQAAMDNAAGMASGFEIARFYAEKPLAQRPRTMKFIFFSDHHHGEVARGRPEVGIDATYPWEKVALKLTMEHPSQTLLYMYNDGITPSNAVGAFRWNALGSPAFEAMVFNTLREFGVSVYATEDGPKNGNYAPSFHIIDHVIYHTSLDVPELVPATGLERATRAFVAAIDRVNDMSMAELRGPSFPPSAPQGTLTGVQSTDN